MCAKESVSQGIKISVPHPKICKNAYKSITKGQTSVLFGEVGQNICTHFEKQLPSCGIRTKTDNANFMFSKVIGQASTKQRLVQSADTGRIPHAQLLLGATGYGSLALAIAYAQYLLCTQRKNGDACGKCDACAKSHKFIHPDLHFSFPTVGTKALSAQFLGEWRSAISENPYMNAAEWLARIGADNKQGNIPVAECEDIVKKLSLKTFEGTYKILLQWMPEYLGKEGNRLLKMIEEPPENTIFLLVAENAELILPTVLSRCQILKVPPLSDEDIASALSQNRNLPPSTAEELARLADGDLGEALRLVENEQNDNAALFLAWMRSCWKGMPNEMVDFAENFAKLGRENQKQFFLYGLFFLREMMAYMLTGDQTALRLRPNELTTALNLAKVLNYHQLAQLATNLNDSHAHIERNANPKILMLDLSIQANSILKGHSGA
jgi:DNA polymerase-3 subunit delta'